MKIARRLLIGILYAALLPVWLLAQDQNKEDEEYQRKLEEWKRQKEAIEKQNQEKLNSLGAQKGSKARFKAGNDYFKQGDYAAAVREFQEAIRLDPNYQRAYANLGLAYKKLGDFQSAITNYDKAVTLPNGDREIARTAQSYKVNLYIDTKDYKKAIETIDVFLKDDPKSDEMLYLKGKVLKDGLGKTGDAIPYLRQSIEANGSNAKAYLDLAGCQNVTGDYSGAIENALKGLQNSREAEITAALNFELGDAYRKSGNTSEAVKYYTNSKTSRRYRDSAEYWLKSLARQ